MNTRYKQSDDSSDPFGFFKFSPRPQKGPSSSRERPPRRNSRKVLSLVLLALCALLALANHFLFSRALRIIPFSEFKDRIASGEIVKVVVGSPYFVGYTSARPAPSARGFSLLSEREAPTYHAIGVLSDSFLSMLDERQVVYSIKPRERNYLIETFQYLFPLLILFFVWRFFFKRMASNVSGLGSSIFSAGHARSAAVEEGKVTTRFADVAGVDEAKEELMEVVDFLKFPKKYTEIGGKIPRGVLLVGPPGTGKTLLARAVAGEASVPFFRISGSDFIEMFVGIGASRVRDLFKQAREKAPGIIFIDELDAIGKSRLNAIHSNDEREQTLNQLLVEMDGFDNTTGLILLAATNRPDVLDPALLRPGRFDRQVCVDRPDLKGREAILRIHAQNVKLAPEVDLKAVARITGGYSGADLANVVNEAALLAVRSGRAQVIETDLDEAVEKTMIGLQKKSRVIREEERRIIAYHETGHALAGTFTKGADKVHKITIIPRGTSALGYTFHIPEDDRHIVTEQQLLAEVDVLLSGRAAEFVAFGEVSTGAGNDISRATDIVRKMITDYGMSEKFQNVALTRRGTGYLAEPQLAREYSECTQQYVDEEVARVLAERYRAVVALLTEKKELLEYIATRLLERETIERDELEEVIRCEHDLEGLKKRLSQQQEGASAPAQGQSPPS